MSRIFWWRTSLFVLGAGEVADIEKSILPPQIPRYDNWEAVPGT